VTDTQAKLNVLLKNPMWENFEEYLKELEIKELKSMLRASTNEDLYRKQGRAMLLEELLFLKRRTLGDN
jgi:hypothetical protein